MALALLSGLSGAEICTSGFVCICDKSLTTVYFAFAFVNVNGEEIADKMMKASEYIDHVYPGADTRRYINKIVLRLTVFGTLYLILFTALPFSLLLWDKDLLRLTMIPGTFLMFVGMIYNIREEIRALRVNQRYTRIF